MEEAAAGGEVVFSLTNSARCSINAKALFIVGKLQRHIATLTAAASYETPSTTRCSSRLTWHCAGGRGTISGAQRAPLPPSLISSRGREVDGPGVRSAICALRETHSHPNFVGWSQRSPLSQSAFGRAGQSEQEPKRVRSGGAKKKRA